MEAGVLGGGNYFVLQHPGVGATWAYLTYSMLCLVADPDPVFRGGGGAPPPEHWNTTSKGRTMKKQ